MVDVLARLVVQLLLRDEETHPEQQTAPAVAHELCDPGPQLSAVSEGFLARGARVAGQRMAEGGAELLPGAAPFLPTLLGMTPGATASSPFPGAGVHSVP